MKGIKQVFDPKGILNPGKMFVWKTCDPFLAGRHRRKHGPMVGEKEEDIPI